MKSGILLGQPIPDRFSGRRPTLMAVSDGTLTGRELTDRVEAILSGGVDSLQLREKALGDLELYHLAVAVLSVCRRYRARLLINGRADIALAAGADGVHLGGTALPVNEVGRLAGKRLIIGFSVHGRDDLKNLRQADYATISPVFTTECKPGAQVLGTGGLAEICSLSPVPLLALGGMTAERLPDTGRAGAVGAAFMSGLFGVSDPLAAARKIVRSWEKAQAEQMEIIGRGGSI